MATKPLPGVAPVSSENLQFVIPVDSVGEPPLVAPVLQENMQFVMPEVREPSMFEMTRDFNEFKSYYQAGAFDSDIEGVGDVTDIALEAGGAILSDVGSWLGSLPQRVAANFSDDPKVRAKAKATTLQVLGSLGENYEALGAGVKRGVYKMTEDEGSDLDLHSAWKYWQKTADLESQRQGLAAEVLANGIFGISGDAWTAGMSDEEKKLIREGIVKPDVEAAMGGAMIVDPLNYFPIGLAYRGATGGSKAALTGAERVLLKETQDMLNLQAKMLPTSKFFLAANTAEMTAVGARQKAALAELNTKIAANSAKLPPLAQKRTIALNAMKDSLPEGSAMRGLLDDALTDVPISAGRNITGIAAASAPVVAGKFIETLGNVGAFLKMLPYETAVNTVMKIAEKAAGKEISEETAKKLLLGGAVFGAGYASTGRAESGAIEFLLPDIGKVELAAAATALLGPTFLKRFGRDLSIAGRQLANPKETLPYLGALAAKGSEKLVDQIIDRDVLVPVASVARRVTGAAEGKIPQRMFLPQGKLGPVSSGIATFMDRSGLGRYAETAGRAARGGAQGAAVAGAFGLAASGGMENPEAFYGSLGVGAILGTAGSTFGSVARFDSPAQHWTARYGDYEYYIKNYLGEGQKENFNKLNRDLQIAVAHKIVTNPSLEVTFASKGKTAGGGHLNRLTNALEINVDSPRAMEALISHEFTHYLEQTGGKLAFNELLIGNSILGKPGIFVERVTPETKSKYPDLNVGDPIMVGEEGARRYKFTKEFETARKEYKDKLKDTDEFSNLTEAQLDLIMTDELVVSEIVAEHGTDFFANDRRRYRDLHRGAIGKVMEGLLDTQLASNVPFLRKALAMLGGTFRPDGRLITDNALFSKLKRYPQITELVRKYNRRIEGLSPEQMKKKTASVDGDGNVISTKDVVVDVTGAELSKNPELVDLIRAGTFLQIDKDGNVIPNLAMTSREKGKYNRSFAQSLKDAIERQDADIGLPEGHVKPEVNEKTGKVKFVGRYLDDSVLDAVEKSGNWNKEQIAMLREANNNIKNRGGNEFLISYFKAAHQGGRRYINAKVENLVEVPYGIEITQQGNVLIRTVSVDQLIKNVDQLTRQQQRELTRLYGADLNTAKTMLLNDVDAYHRNHAAGEPGRTGLDADQAIAKAKADFINSAFGSGTKAQVDANPWRAGLGKKQPRDVYRSRRIERIGKITQLSGERYVDYNLINKAFMPRRKPGPDDTIPLPFPELPGDIPGEGFGRLINVDKSKSEIAKAKAMADEQDGFSSSGTVRAKNADGRDKLYMPADEAGAPKGKQAEAAKLWQEKGTDSPFFKKWFGKSKVVDESGEPLRVFHGTDKEFSAFDPSKLGDNTDAASAKEAFFASSSESVAESYMLGDSGGLGIFEASERGSVLRGGEKLSLELGRVLEGENNIRRDIEAAKAGGEYLELADYLPDSFLKISDEHMSLFGDSGQKIADAREGNFLPLESVGQLWEIQTDISHQLRKWNGLLENASVKELFLKIENPYDVKWSDKRGMTISDIIAHAKANGHDGGIIRSIEDAWNIDGSFNLPPADHHFWFKPEQAKSATGNRGTFDAGDPNMLFMPADEAGAPKGKQAEAAKLWQEKGTDSPFFKKWFGKLENLFGRSKVVDESGEPLLVAHGTTKKFNEFDISKTSNATFDVGYHFGGKETAQSRLKDLDHPTHPLHDWYGEPQIKEVYLDIKTPLRLGENRSGSWQPSDYLAAIFDPENTFWKTNKIDPKKVPEAFRSDIKKYMDADEVADMHGGLIQASVKGLGKLAFQDLAEHSYMGKQAGHEWVKNYLKSKGFDGIIYTNKFEGGGDSYIAFSPEQIKSATGNRGTFDAGDPNMLFMPAATPESVSPNTVQSWDGDPSFPGKYTRGQAKSNDDVGKLFQEKYVEKYGEPINPYDYTPETTGWLGGMLYGEAKVALARAGNAVDWYTKAVAKAMTIAEDIFPEIKTSAAAKDNFLGALAITSQNMRVLDNARAAVHQYDYKQKHGVFDYKKKHGGKGKMITENLRMFDTLEAKLGSDFNAFLDKDFTVKELTEFGQKFFGKEKFTIEGRINDEVKGSAVFGPKIGQGFFQNLKGNYLPVTIDLWLRRTFGRLTGRSVSIKLKRDDIGRLIYSHRKNKGKRKAKDFELPDFLKKVQITGGFTKDGKMNFKIPESTFDRLFGEHEQGMANAEAVFDLTKRLAKEWGREYSTTDRAVAKLKAELSKQKKAGQPVKQTAARLEKAEAAKATLLEEKPFWAFASASISGKLKPIDIPTPQERTVIVDAFHFALKKLKAEGYDLTPADLQATLWYPEKDIWAFLKGENADSLNMSYDKAMEMIRDERR